jgi:hypothetical protein
MRPPAGDDLRQPRVLHERMPQLAHFKDEQDRHSGAGTTDHAQNEAWPIRRGWLTPCAGGPGALDLVPRPDDAGVMIQVLEPAASGPLADSATSAGGLGWLALTVVVSAGVAGLVNLLIGRLNVGFVRKKELEASVSSAFRQERARREMDRSERIRGQVVALAGPIRLAAQDLLHRLSNIIDDDGDAALDPGWDDRQPVNWSMSHEYQLRSTEYLFARFFAYSEILRDSLGSDLQGEQTDPGNLMDSMVQVGRALSEYPIAEDVCEGEDAQVFLWQQRALGSLLRPSGDTSRVLNYAEFLDDVPAIDKHLSPVTTLLEALPSTPRSGCHWARMHLARTALNDVIDSCGRLLAGPSHTASEY